MLAVDTDQFANKQTKKNKVAASRKRGRSQKNNNAKPTSLTIPAAMQTRYQPKQITISNRIQGSDNLEVLSTAASTVYPLGATVIAGGLTAHSSARLSSLANAFQRVRWNAMSFTIEGAYPTTSGGGYVTCFVRDPDDLPPTDPVQAVKWAMAQQHSADAKWYDSVRLNVGRTPDLLFTSVGDSARLFSPGTLYVISKNGPAQVGSLTINFHWDVTFSEPTSETNQKGLSEWTVPMDLTLPLSVASGAATHLSLCTSNATPPSPDPAVTARVAKTPASLGLGAMPIGTYLRMKNPVTVLGVYNNAGATVNVNINGFVVTATEVIAVSEHPNSNGAYFFLLGGLTSNSLPTGYQNSDWHTIGHGFGAVLMQGEKLSIYGAPAEVQILNQSLMSKTFFHWNEDNIQPDTSTPYAITTLSGEL